MTGQSSIVISFIIYLSFFGWLGWRRGVRRELIVFLVAVILWLILQERGDTVVNIANLGGAALSFAQAGGFGENQQEAFAALAEAPAIIDTEAREPFLFVLWVGIFVATYALTNVAVADKISKRNGWAVVLGMLNGLFFAIAFLPSLVAIFSPEGTLITAGGLGLSTVLRGGLELLWGGLATIWGGIISLGPMALLVMVTLLLVLAASTINNAKAKES
ncbi:MAG: hypothetical protein WDZ49_12730 [Litorilinea sp.]